MSKRSFEQSRERVIQPESHPESGRLAPNDAKRRVEKLDTERQLSATKRNVETKMRLSLADEVAQRRRLSEGDRVLLQNDVLRARDTRPRGEWKAEGRQPNWNDFHAESKPMREISQYIREEPVFQPDRWKSASETERDLALNRLNEVAARAHHVPGAIDVRSESFKEHGDLRTRGTFDPEDAGIRLNRRLTGADSSEPRAAIKVTLHEFRHSMQDTAAEFEDKPPHRDGTEFIPDRSKVEALRSNREQNYVDPTRAASEGAEGDTYSRYLAQPREADARAYASHIMREAFGEDLQE